MRPNCYDFVCLEDVSEGIISFVKDSMKYSDIEFTKITNLEKNNNSFKFKVEYNQFDGFKASVRIDLSLRGDVAMDHPSKPILHFYKTLPSAFSVPAMALDEIMAEKIRAVIYTRHPRHLYDIHYLHHHGIKINPNMVKAKIKSTYHEDFDIDKLKERLPEKAKKWMTDLRPVMPVPPPSFTEVSKKVLEIITNAMTKNHTNSRE